MNRAPDDDLGFMWDFLQRRGWGKGGLELDPPSFRRAFQDALIALLRSEVELGAHVRSELADELERYRWPNAQKQHWQHSLNHLMARALNKKLCTLAAELRQQGVHDPVRQAEARVAQEHGFASGKAMNRWIRRQNGR